MEGCATGSHEMCRSHMSMHTLDLRLEAEADVHADVQADATTVLCYVRVCWVVVGVPVGMGVMLVHVATTKAGVGAADCKRALVGLYVLYVLYVLLVLL